MKRQRHQVFRRGERRPRADDIDGAMEFYFAASGIEDDVVSPDCGDKNLAVRRELRGRRRHEAGAAPGNIRQAIDLLDHLVRLDIPDKESRILARSGDLLSTAKETHGVDRARMAGERLRGLG